MFGKGSLVAKKNQVLIKEEHYRLIEIDLASAVEKAKLAKIDKKEVVDMLEVLYEE